MIRAILRAPDGVATPEPSMSRFPDRYRKLVIHALTGDFRSSTSVATQAWSDPGPGQVAVRNRHAGCNAIFDKNLCRNGVRYVDIVPPYDMGIESVGEVVAVGHGVTSLREGDAVATTKLGTGYREYQLVEAARAIPIRAATPEILTLIPTGISGMVGLERVGELRGGETVAVSAAGGGRRPAARSSTPSSTTWRCAGAS